MLVVFSFAEDEKENKNTKTKIENLKYAFIIVFMNITKNKIYKINAQSIANKSTGGFISTLISLFLAILCFFIILNVNSNQSAVNYKAVAESLGEEFKNKTISQKINEVSNGRKTDAAFNFNQSSYEQLYGVIKNYKSQVNFKTNFYNNSLEIIVSEAALINFEENKFRKQASSFLSDLAVKVNELSASDRVKIKITAYKKDYSNPAEKLDFLNKIYAIFERANIINYPLEFFVSLNRELGDDIIKININVTKN